KSVSLTVESDNRCCPAGSPDASAGDGSSAAVAGTVHLRDGHHRGGVPGPRLARGMDGHVRMPRHLQRGVERPVHLRVRLGAGGLGGHDRGCEKKAEVNATADAESLSMDASNEIGFKSPVKPTGEATNEAIMRPGSLSRQSGIPALAAKKDRKSHGGMADERGPRAL